MVNTPLRMFDVRRWRLPALLISAAGPDSPQQRGWCHLWSTGSRLHLCRQSSEIHLEQQSSQAELRVDWTEHGLLGVGPFLGGNIIKASQSAERLFTVTTSSLSRSRRTVYSHET